MDVLLALFLTLVILAVAGFLTLLFLGLARRGAKKVGKAVIPPSVDTNHDPFGTLNPSAVVQPKKEPLLLPIDTKLLFKIGVRGFLICAVLTALIMVPPLFGDRDYWFNLGFGFLFALQTIIGMIGFGVMALVTFFINAAKSRNS